MSDLAPSPARPPDAPSITETPSVTDTPTVTDAPSDAPSPLAHATAPLMPDGVHEAFEAVPGGDARLLLVADHASNRLPDGYPPALGLPPAEFERHIAYDIGVEGTARLLATALDAPLVISRFSRLLIDPNRGEDDPTLLMQLSDGAIVPANARVDEAERTRRLERYWRPYDRAVADAVAALTARAKAPPVIVSLHSFTPSWRGVPRPWHVGVLHDADMRASDPIIAALRAPGDLVVGDNEPYSGAMGGDMLNRQAMARGLPHALIEFRQDLIGTEAGQREWAARTAPILDAVRGASGIRELRYHYSWAP